jgi:hypothetical protein
MRLLALYFISKPDLASETKRKLLNAAILTSEEMECISNLDLPAFKDITVRNHVYFFFPALKLTSFVVCQGPGNYHAQATGQEKGQRQYQCSLRFVPLCAQNEDTTRGR